MNDERCRRPEVISYFDIDDNVIILCSCPVFLNGAHFRITQIPPPVSEDIHSMIYQNGIESLASARNPCAINKARTRNVINL